MPADRSPEHVIPKSFAPRWPRIAAAVLCLACIAPALAAIDEDDLLPVDQAFVLTAKATSADRIALDWKIADGYYLYRHRTKAVATDGSRLGALDLPHGEPHDDEFFGRVETFRKHLGGSVPVQAADGGKVVLKVSYQGCADAGVCYPPQSRTLTVAMPAGAGANAVAVVGAASAAPGSRTASRARGQQKLAAEAAPARASAPALAGIATVSVRDCGG
jgi:thiol:disulfide interchange protein DsbD